MLIVIGPDIGTYPISGIPDIDQGPVLVICPDIEYVPISGIPNIGYDPRSGVHKIRHDILPYRYILKGHVSRCIPRYTGYCKTDN